MAEKILAICIPTYNRAKILDKALSKLLAEYNSLRDKEQIEIIVSDNCSPDNTPKIVEKYICQGLPINYVRNNENLGMDGNFVQCFRMAKAKYVWVLGDDDYIMDDKLSALLDLLSDEKDYGLIHFKILNNRPFNGKSKDKSTFVFDNSKYFLREVSYWVTYISSNIVATKYVSEIDFEKYMGTYFTIVPLYLTAAYKSEFNLMINERFFLDGVDVNRSGGYNFFKVFVEKYLRIRKEYYKKYKNFFIEYQREKYILFRFFLLGNIKKLLIDKKIGMYDVRKGWKIILKYYGFCPYFYILLILYLLKNRK